MARLTKRQSGEQKLLHEQLDFFGAKKKRFISIYAKKPHIRLKVKGDNLITCPPIGVGSLGLQQLAARGHARSMLAAQQSQLAASGEQSLAGSQFGYAGGLGGLGQGVAGLGAVIT